MKNRIREIAHQLIKIAAARQLRKAPKLMPPARGLRRILPRAFPLQETEDQQAAIERRLDDLAAGKPMDRLDLWRRRLWQNRSGLARCIRRSHRRQAGCSRRSHDTIGAPALQDLFASALPACRSRWRNCRAWSLPPISALPKQGLADGTIDIAVGTHALLGKGRGVQGPRAGNYRRRATLRRQPQGTPEGIARRSACADFVCNTHTAHIAARAERRARTLADRLTASRPACRAHIHNAVRRIDRARSLIARTVPRRSELLMSARASRTRRCIGIPAHPMCRKQNSSSPMAR